MTSPLLAPERLRALRDKGVTVAEIAAFAGVSPKTVHAALRRAGLPPSRVRYPKLLDREWMTSRATVPAAVVAGPGLDLWNTRVVT